MKSQVKISIDFADTNHSISLRKEDITDILTRVCENENCVEGSIGLVFVDEKKIHELNRKFLDHDCPTDVISFTLNERDEPLYGEIYVCTDVAREQSQEFKVTYEEEVVRLSVHGLLHLLGYDDRSEAEREAMFSLGERYVKSFYLLEN